MGPICLFGIPSNRLGGSGTKASKPSAHLMVTGFLEEFLQSGMPENLATKDVPTWEELAMKLRAVMESKGCKKGLWNRIVPIRSQTYVYI